MVDLRKRKTLAEPAAPPPPAKKANSVKSAASSQKGEPSANGSATTKKTTISLGDTINLDDFGGEIETNDGEKVTLKKLVDESKSGIVIFTYPKASTPGCKIPPLNDVCRRKPRKSKQSFSAFASETFHPLLNIGRSTTNVV